MHILEEWRLRDIEQKAEHAASRLYELDAFRSDMAALERTVGELRATCDGLRDEVARLQARIETLETPENA